jgi:integrase
MRQATAFIRQLGNPGCASAGIKTARGRSPTNAGPAGSPKAAGLPAGTRFHDLRHFYASSLIAAGLHLKVIQERLGHAAMAETMDTYGPLFPDASEHGRGALDAVSAPAGVRPMCARQRS